MSKIAFHGGFIVAKDEAERLGNDPAAIHVLLQQKLAVLRKRITVARIRELMAAEPGENKEVVD